MIQSKTFLFMLLLCRVSAESKFSFTVAVYEHEAYSQENKKLALPKAEALHIVSRNMKVYREQARSAAAQNARMIVFPENGLYGGRLDRDSIVPYLEDIPAPDGTFCPGKSFFDSKFNIQYNLSHIARENRIYVISTVADTKLCVGKWKKSCPEDGRWQFNTAVVYNPDGCLVARYHKEHLFFEESFDAPVKTEFATFDVEEYGKFGLAICFDILYKLPMVDLVEDHNVGTIILPSAWMDVMPLMSSIGFHSSWATGMKINLLVANRYLPNIEMSGSGIYSPNGPIAYICRNESETARLVVATLPPLTKEHAPLVTPTPLNMSLGELIRQVEAPHFTFKAWLFHDHFKFILMRSKSGLKKVCEHQFCCYLRYEMEEYLPDELYAFGAFWGLHTFDGDYYIQSCAVVRCRLGDLHSTCGSPIITARTKFRSLYIDGTFNSTYVFPIVVTNNMTLPENGEVQFSKYPFPFLESKTGISRPLVAAGLLARLYDKDAASGLRPGLLSLMVAILVKFWLTVVQKSISV